MRTRFQEKRAPSDQLKFCTGRYERRARTSPGLYAGTLVMDKVKKQGLLLDEVDQKLDHAHIRKETACGETERAHRRIADAEGVEITASEAFGAYSILKWTLKMHSPPRRHFCT